MESPKTFNKIVSTGASASGDVLEGICVTCNRGASCVNARRSSRPIWECDEFDDSVPTSPVPSPSGRLEGTSRAEEDPAPSARGLCSTCVHNAVCNLPRPAGGVWHCEEFSQ